MFLIEIKSLKDLNLAIEFHGVLPLNELFIGGLQLFKISRNKNLYYCHYVLSTISKVWNLRYHIHGLTVSVPLAIDDDPSRYDNSDSNYNDSDGGKGKRTR